jgi:hypothetical protein
MFAAGFCAGVLTLALAEVAGVRVVWRAVVSGKRDSRTVTPPAPPTVP